jgi:hypothetical protein
MLKVFNDVRKSKVEIYRVALPLHIREVRDSSLGQETEYPYLTIVMDFFSPSKRILI